MGGALRVVCVGWGALMPRAAALMARHVPAARLVGIGIRAGDGEKSAAKYPENIPLLAGPEALEKGFADLVIEAAGPGTVRPWGEAALKAARVFAPLSVGAFAQGDTLAHLVRLAEEQGSRLVIPNGAIGGLDALRSMGFAGLDRVTHEIVKPARAWRGTEAERHLDLAALDGPTLFAELSAREAATRYPQNANVCAMVAMAGLGFERTRVRLVADPAAPCNSHIITAEGPSGRFTIRLDNNPMPGNPKSSEMTALSLVHLVEKLTARVVW